MLDGEFDWKAPNYVAVLTRRMERLAWIREAPAQRLPPLKTYYRDHPADFINDWGMTFDPRNIERGLPATIPFVLFPRQREWVDWTMERWRGQRPGLAEKSRDCGVSWLAVGLGCTLCTFLEGMAVGYGSRKEEYVDKSNQPKSLFFKARAFMKGLPPEFKPGWDVRRDAPHMQIRFPWTGSTMTGEAGDGIGRGDRQAIYFVDESAHLERPVLVDASLSATTNCRIDISSVNGMANPFATKRWSWSADRIFIFDWRDDPRKDQAWYDRQLEDLDPVTIAQEIDRNYSASVEGALIPSAWVSSAIGALEFLGISPTGEKRGGLDIADGGKDLNAFAGAHGPLLEYLEEWSGKGADTDDIFKSVQKAFWLSDGLGYPGFLFDQDGLGAGARGDARVINELREKAGQRPLKVTPFRGSAAVVEPNREDEKGRLNEDFFANLKAQSWWEVRRLFRNVHRAVEAKKKGEPWRHLNPDDFISISPSLPLLNKLKGELAQPTYILNTAGKILVDKQPEGTKSPNLADAVMIAYSRGRKHVMQINSGAAAAI